MLAITAASAAITTPPHILFVVGDDVGYSVSLLVHIMQNSQLYYQDFGYFNDNKTITPTIDGLLGQGIFLSDYYTFKICSPNFFSFFSLY